MRLSTSMQNQDHNLIGYPSSYSKSHCNLTTPLSDRLIDLLSIPTYLPHCQIKTRDCVFLGVNHR